MAYRRVAKTCNFIELSSIPCIKPRTNRKLSENSFWFGLNISLLSHIIVSVFLIFKTSVGLHLNTVWYVRDHFPGFNCFSVCENAQYFTWSGDSDLKVLVKMGKMWKSKFHRGRKLYFLHSKSKIPGSWQKWKRYKTETNIYINKCNLKVAGFHLSKLS